ncbi:MAG TPA: ATP-binding cassette domain-containing protein [Syntrophomonadaceae bacterium]|nr:ATP-binding cassette domain-containing protein [Syntrophomonadaceae bacterium]
MEELLSFQNLYYKFPHSSRYIKESGQVLPHDFLIVQGPSGAGKSTLLKLIARLIRAESGEVFFRGKAQEEYPANEWRLNIQYLAQHPIMFTGTVADNLLQAFDLKMVADKKELPPANLIKKYLGAIGFNEKILQQSAKTLSGGEKARIAVLRAILIEPTLLLLDEPSAYLDEASREKTMQLLNDWVVSGKRGIIMVSHNSEDLALIENYNILNLLTRGDGDGK